MWRGRALAREPTLNPDLRACTNKNGADSTPRQFRFNWTLLLLRQHNLRQRVAAAIFRECVVGVDDPRTAIARIDGYLKQIKKNTSARSAACAARANYSNVVWCVAGRALREAGAVIVCLRQISIPDRARIILARG